MYMFQKWKVLALISLFILGVFYTPGITNANTTILPKTSQPPNIDGNLTSTANEWQNSVIFNTTVGGNDASIRLTSSSTNVFFGINYTIANFIPVNDTAYNSSINSPYGYNGQTHDWLAIEINNKIDQVSLGTKTAPNDVFVADQYNNSFYDGYANGNSSFPFFPDNLNNGSNDGTGARNSYSISGGTQVVYEFSKPYNTNDVNGSDFNLSARVLQFRVLFWFNQTSDAPFSNSFSTTWYTLRLNNTGTGLLTKAYENTTINLDVGSISSDTYKAFETILPLYGFKLDINKNGSPASNTTDLRIIILSSQNVYDANRTNELINYLELGGRAMIFFDSSSPQSTSISSDFGLTFLKNNVLQNTTDPTNLSVNSTEINNKLPFLAGNSTVTNNKVTGLSLQANAFDYAALLNKTKNPFVLRQSYLMYNLFNTNAHDFYYDSNGNSVVDSSESFGNMSMGLIFDLMYGGRISLFASSTLINNNYLTNSDNLLFILRMIPWNAKLVNTLKSPSITISNYKAVLGDVITITMNVTNGFNETMANINLQTILKRDTGILARENLTYNPETKLYTANISISYTGSMSFETSGYLSGYGFVVGKELELFVEPVRPSINNLSKINIIMVATFIAGLILLVLGYIKLSKVKID